MSDTAPEKILAGLKDAILTEHTGSNFYTVAATNTGDAKGKEVFLMLAAEEALHIDYLKRQYGLLHEGKAPESLIPDGAGTVLTGDSPVFSEELLSRIGEAHWEMTALSVGLQLEQNTVTRYRQLAAETTSPELKRFFEELTRWEEGHAAALSKQSSYLREAYWSAAGFVPF
jgi:rubrerythrin